MLQVFLAAFACLSLTFPMARKRARQRQSVESNMKKRKMEETSDEHKWKYAVDQYHGESPFEGKKDLHPLLHEVARVTGFSFDIGFLVFML